MTFVAETTDWLRLPSGRFPRALNEVPQAPLRGAITAEERSVGSGKSVKSVPPLVCFFPCSRGEPSPKGYGFNGFSGFHGSAPGGARNSSRPI